MLLPGVDLPVKDVLVIARSRSIVRLPVSEPKEPAVGVARGVHVELVCALHVLVGGVIVSTLVTSVRLFKHLPGVRGHLVPGGEELQGVGSDLVAGPGFKGGGSGEHVALELEDVSPKWVSLVGPLMVLEMPIGNGKALVNEEVLVVAHVPGPGGVTEVVVGS